MQYSKACNQTLSSAAPRGTGPSQICCICTSKLFIPTEGTITALNKHASFAGDSARHCQKLQQLLMLVPGLANVSIASIRTALQRVDIPALSSEAHTRHLEAAGALIQQLCQAETTQVGFGHHCEQLFYSAT